MLRLEFLIRIRICNCTAAQLDFRSFNEWLMIRYAGSIGIGGALQQPNGRFFTHPCRFVQGGPYP